MTMKIQRKMMAITMTRSKMPMKTKKKTNFQRQRPVSMKESAVSRMNINLQSCTGKHTMGKSQRTKERKAMET